MRNAGLALALVGCTGAGDKGGNSGDTAGVGGGRPVAYLQLSGLELEDTSFYSVGALFSEPTTATTPTAGTEGVPDTCGLAATDTIVTDIVLTQLDPGEVTITIGVEDVVLEDGFAPLDVWPVGDPVSFAASGGELPAFDAPDLLLVPPPPTPITVDADTPGTVTVTWSSAPVDGAMVTIGVFDAVTADFVSCMAEDDGSFDVDVSALGTVGQVVVLRWVHTSRIVGDVQVVADAFIGR